MARVYVTRRIPEPGLELLRRAHDVEVWPGELPPSKEEIIRAAADADALITLLSDPITPEVMDASPRLRVIANYAVGFDNIHVHAATERGIQVTNTPDVLTETTADLAWALMLACARRFKESVKYVEGDRWKTWGPEILLGQDVWGATLGLVGLGRIGRAVARRASGFGMRVLYYTPSRHAVEGAEWTHLEALLRESDFVSLHTPLTPETHQLINAERLALMKPTAVLVNTARGAVVDSRALHAALSSGTLFAAGLDVTDPEPLPSAHPLNHLPNCLVVPHIGSASVATRSRMAVMAARNVLAVLAGEPPENPVNTVGVRR